MNKKILNTVVLTLVIMLSTPFVLSTTQTTTNKIQDESISNDNQKYESMVFSPSNGDRTDVLIEITPYNPPITISQYGGNYQYTIEVINNESSSISFNIWTMYTLPGGSPYGPVFGAVDVQLPDKWSAYREDLSDYLAGDMPEGNYTLIANVGIYPDTIWNSDSFTFIKLPNSGGWYLQNPGNDEDLEAVSFSDENNGWAVGGIFDSYNEHFIRYILHTSDGGDNWNTQLYQSGYYYDLVGPLNDIYFTDSPTIVGISKCNTKQFVIIP